MQLPNLQSTRLASLPNISHLFTTRRGGVSKGQYSSLNCSRYSGDELTCIEENQRRILKAMGSKKLASLRQVHSNTVFNIDKSWADQDKVEGDGMVTRESGVALAVMGADCAPVLLADPKNKIIGAAHAGWKGALSGIVDNVIHSMCKLGAERELIVAAIGPAIQQASYEVGQAFMEHFISTEGTRCQRFFCVNLGRIHFDLPGYIVERLKFQGILHIDCLPQDTCSMEQEFFSYRRISQQGEADYGRQLGAICLFA